MQFEPERWYQLDELVHVRLGAGTFQIADERESLTTVDGRGEMRTIIRIERSAPDPRHERQDPYDDRARQVG